MPGLKRLLLSPVRLVLDPLEGWIKGKLAGLIDARLEPVREDLKTINSKLDTVLDINLAPDVLRDFRAHNEALRAIRADCDLMRELNPMVQSMLRDLMRLQLQCEELAWRLDQAAGASPAELRGHAGAGIPRPLSRGGSRPI
jgi:hypothetical protein